MIFTCSSMCLRTKTWQLLYFGKRVDRGGLWNRMQDGMTHPNMYVTKVYNMSFRATPSQFWWLGSPYNLFSNLLVHEVKWGAVSRGLWSPRNKHLGTYFIVILHVSAYFGTINKICDYCFIVLLFLKEAFESSCQKKLWLITFLRKKPKNLLHSQLCD
jgi:hypothetical protein